MTRRDYAELLALGAYPAVRQATPRMRSRWIDADLHGVVGRDLAGLGPPPGQARGRPTQGGGD